MSAQEFRRRLSPQLGEKIGAHRGAMTASRREELFGAILFGIT